MVSFLFFIFLFRFLLFISFSFLVFLFFFPTFTPIFFYFLFFLRFRFCGLLLLFLFFLLCFLVSLSFDTLWISFEKKSKTEYVWFRHFRWLKHFEFSPTWLIGSGLRATRDFQPFTVVEAFSISSAAACGLEGQDTWGEEAWLLWWGCLMPGSNLFYHPESCRCSAPILSRKQHLPSL